MALTSRDETDLLLPLYTGLSEDRPFSTFLERLRRRTAAEYVAIAVRTGESAIDQAMQLFAGRDLARLAREVGTPEMLMADKIQYDALRPGRVYGMAEFTDHDPLQRAEHEAHMRSLGIADQRIVRLIAEPALDAWLTLARAEPCTAADSALLSNLAPYLTEAVRSLVREEARSIAARATAEALVRGDVGWIRFDGEARVLAIDPTLSSRFATLGLPAPRVGERLRDLAADAARALGPAVIAHGPCAVLLYEQPRVEAVLKAPCDEAPGQAPAGILALCRVPHLPAPDRAELVAQLHALPVREAELAVSLSDGLSIAEAAAAMGLTLETARNYSKRLYAKLGVRGQAELVALVLRGAAALG